MIVPIIKTKHTGHDENTIKLPAYLFIKEHNNIKDNSREKGKENGTDEETNFAIAIREGISDLKKLHRIGEGE